MKEPLPPRASGPLASSTTSGSSAATELLAWPPPSEDLDAIEVIDLEAAPVLPAPPAASKRPPVSEPAEPAPAPGASPPAEPVYGALVEILELDAHGGPEPYLVDIRTPRATVAVSTSAEAIGPPPDARTAFDGGVPSAPASPEDARAVHSSPVEWPPKEDDLDAIHVLELEPARPTVPTMAASGEVEAPAASATPPDLNARPHTRTDAAVVLAADALIVPAASVDDALPDLPLQPGRRARALASRQARAERRPRRWPLAVAASAMIAGGTWAGVQRDAWNLPALWPSSTAETTTPGAATRGTPSTTSPPAVDDRVIAPAAEPASDAAPRFADAPPLEATDIPPPSTDVADALIPARLALARGDRAEALRLAVSLGRERLPSADAFITDLLRRAQTDVASARQAALTRGGSPSDPAFVVAGAAESTAVADWRAGRFERALRGLGEAERAYRRAPDAPVAPVADIAPDIVPPPTGSAGTSEVTVPAPPAPATASAAPVELPIEAPSRLPAPSSTPPASTERTAAASPRPPGDAMPTALVADDAGVRRALRTYQAAYERLDAGAAAAIYPTLDARALARAFDGLRSQKLEFERCDVTAAATSARATCTGRTAFVPKVGSQTPRVEARRWVFTLERRDVEWRITRATVGEP